MPQSVPDTSRQAQAQEVELQMYDSDSLPSPPPSSESEGEKDPLLDFTREDTLTYTPGQPSQTLAESVREATEALEVRSGCGCRQESYTVWYRAFRS